MSKPILSIQAIESHLEMLKRKQENLKKIRFTDLRNNNEMLSLMTELCELTGQIKAFNSVLNSELVKE